MKIIRSKNPLSYYHNYWNNVLRLINNVNSIMLNKSFITSKLLLVLLLKSINQ